MKGGLVLMGLIAVAAVCGSFSPAAGAAVYGSRWFAALLGALVLNTGFCAFTRRPGLGSKRSLRGVSVFLIHISVIVLALSSIWASFAFGSDALRLSQGGEAEAGGKKLVLESVRVERYPDGSVSDWVSSVSWGGDPGEIRVNHPLRSGGTKILQAGYGREYSVSLRLPGEASPRALRVDQGVPVTVSAKDGIAISVAPLGGLEGDSGAAAELSLIGGGKVLQRAQVGIAQAVALGGSGIEIAIGGSKPYAVFIVRKTPGIEALWAGMALLALSSCGLLFGFGATSKKGE
jgi:hypothetical protein